MVNDAISYFAIAEAPHGGCGLSGWGRTHGKAGLLEMVQTKYIDVDRLPRREKPWWFATAPISSKPPMRSCNSSTPASSQRASSQRPRRPENHVPRSRFIMLLVARLSSERRGLDANGAEAKSKASGTDSALQIEE